MPKIPLLILISIHLSFKAVLAGGHHSPWRQWGPSISHVLCEETLSFICSKSPPPLLQWFKELEAKLPFSIFFPHHVPSTIRIPEVHQSLAWSAHSGLEGVSEEKHIGSYLMVSETIVPSSFILLTLTSLQFQTGVFLTFPGDEVEEFLGSHSIFLG